MKDSTMILILAAILASAALPAIGTSVLRVAKAATTIEQVRSTHTHRVSQTAGVSVIKGWLQL